MSKLTDLTRRQQILQVSSILFREKGFKATSVRDIASAMNMEAASLYSHIKSKDEILQELVFTIASKFENGMKAIDQSSYTPIQKVKALISLQLRITTENPYAIFLQTQALMHLKEPYKGQYQSIRDQFVNDFTRIAEAGMDEGSIKKMNPFVLVNSILSTSRWLYEWYNKSREINPVELEIQILGMLENGFSGE